MKSVYRFTLALSVCLLLLAPVAVFGQTTGTVEGTVTDQSNAPLPGVTVELTSPSLQGSRTAVTSADGRYRFPSVPPGAYTITAEELVEDAEAIGGLVPVGARSEKRSTVHAFTYPPQQQKLRGSPIDPATGRRAGEIVGHDPDARTLELKRGPVLDDVSLPAALIPGDVYSTKAQEEALERFGRSLLEGGGAYPVLESILRRDPFGRDVQTTDLDETAVGRIAEGAHATVSLDAFPDAAIDGTVASIAPFGTSSAGDIVFTVVIEPSGAVPDGLRWNMTASATIDAAAASAPSN